MESWHLTDILAALLAPPVVFLAGYNYRNIQAAVTLDQAIRS